MFNFTCQGIEIIDLTPKTLLSYIGFHENYELSSC